VNYHALGLFAGLLGGTSFISSQHYSILKTSVLSFPARNSRRRLLHLSRSFRDHVEHFGPADFFLLQKFTKNDAKDISLEHALALLKLSRYDCDIFYKFRSTFISKIRDGTSALRHDVLRGLEVVWNNYFALDKDIAFELSRVFIEAGLHERALKLLDISLSTFGSHFYLSYYRGICFHHLRDYKNAVLEFQKSVEANPEFAGAFDWLQKSEELRSKANGPIPAVVS